jgi:hypothetical protein
LLIEYKRNSEEWYRVLDLISKEIIPEKIFAIYNPSLTVSFINQWKVYQSRKRDNPNIFYSQNYTKGTSKDDDKIWVNDQFNQLCNESIWNHKLDSPILPVYHGI